MQTTAASARARMCASVWHMQMTWLPYLTRRLNLYVWHGARMLCIAVFEISICAIRFRFHNRPSAPASGWLRGSIFHRIFPLRRAPACAIHWAISHSLLVKLQLINYALCMRARVCCAFDAAMLSIHHFESISIVCCYCHFSSPNALRSDLFARW